MKKARTLPLLFLSLATTPVQGADARDWTVELVAQQLVRSHTSYEFGNTEPPYQTPLSRLEFPANALFAGFAIGRSGERLSWRGEILRNVSKSSSGRFKDTDWTGENAPPTEVDIYSEAGTRVRPSYMAKAEVDLRIDDWVSLPRGFDVRPVLGMRWQQLNFVAHDALQIRPFEPQLGQEAFPGDAIRFRQSYWHYFAGLRVGYDFGSLAALQGLKLIGQIDWGSVAGQNADQHLLRGGQRITYENTRGQAWHALLGLSAPLARDIHLDLSMDILRLRTTGSHRLTHDVAEVDMSWSNGVKAWSDQRSIRLNLRLDF